MFDTWPIKTKNYPVSNKHVIYIYTHLFLFYNIIFHRAKENVESNTRVK